ncbi:PqqD family protein [Arcobacter sp. s6]|uniref:PqqD family protein n=1 Tax=Arcobacter sp. s6 TaxID=3230363 RepID=UPI0034A0110D
MNIKSKVTISKNVFAQEIDDETIILDSTTQEYFSLNEIGKVIWSLLSENKNLEQIKEEMLEMYEVPEEQLEKDVLNFLQALEQKGLISID